jgi:hypothetical protein
MGRILALRFNINAGSGFFLGHFSLLGLGCVQYPLPRGEGGGSKGKAAGEGSGDDTFANKKQSLPQKVTWLPLP